MVRESRARHRDTTGVMAQATHAAFDAQHDIDARPAGAARARRSPASMTSGCRSTAILPRSSRSGARSSATPIARCSRPSIGCRRGIATSAPATASMPVIVAGARQRRRAAVHSSARDRASGAVRRLTWLASELCDYNAPLLARGFFAADRRRALPGAVARYRRPPAKPSGPPVRLDPLREDAGEGRRPGQPDARPSGGAQSEQRLSDAA